jgi:hypothetical protein
MALNYTAAENTAIASISKTIICLDKVNIAS